MCHHVWDYLVQLRVDGSWVDLHPKYATEEKLTIEVQRRHLQGQDVRGIGRRETITEKTVIPRQVKEGVNG